MSVFSLTVRANHELLKMLQMTIHHKMLLLQSWLMKVLRVIGQTVIITNVAEPSQHSLPITSLDFLMRRNPVGRRLHNICRKTRKREELQKLKLVRLSSTRWSSRHTLFISVCSVTKKGMMKFQILWSALVLVLPQYNTDTWGFFLQKYSTKPGAEVRWVCTVPVPHRTWKWVIRKEAKEMLKEFISHWMSRKDWPTYSLMQAQWVIVLVYWSTSSR